MADGEAEGMVGREVALGAVSPCSGLVWCSADHVTHVNWSLPLASESTDFYLNHASVLAAGGNLYDTTLPLSSAVAEVNPTQLHFFQPSTTRPNTILNLSFSSLAMDMSIAILEMGEAWLMEHPDHANRRSMLSFTGQCYSHFSSQSTKRDYLDKAIKYLREASGIAEWDPRLEYAEDLEALGVAYMDPRMQEELPEYVDRAIEAFQRAVEATTDGLPYLLTRRSGRLAEAYAVRSERNGKSQDIDQSIHLFEETITVRTIEVHEFSYCRLVTNIFLLDD